jgi:hypothetical protein
VPGSSSPSIEDRNLGRKKVKVESRSNKLDNWGLWRRVGYR